MVKQPKSKLKVRLLPIYLWVISYMKPYFKTLILLILCGIVITLAELALPKFIQFLIDSVFPHQDYGIFFTILAAIIVMFSLMLLAKNAQNLLQRHLQEKAARDLQFSIFRKLRSLGFSYFERHPVGESLALLNTEVTAVQTVFSHFFPWMVSSIIFSAMSVGFMLTISVKLTLVIIPCFLFYYLVGPFLEKRAALIWRQMSQDRVQISKKGYETVSSLIELRANASEQWDKDNFMKLQDNFSRSMQKTNLYSHARGSVRRLANFRGPFFCSFMALTLCGATF